MNKKVDEEFKGIKDVYILQCICTELKELCNKYEEEHNTTFKEWQKDIQANKKAQEYMKKYVEVLIFEDGTEIYQVKNGNKFYEELLDILEKNNATTN